jgi:hypothetical protein
MVRLLLPFLVLAIDIYALVDVITVHEWRIKALNKFAWVVIILFLPLIGAILWFTIGKVHGEPSDDNAGRGRDARRYDTPRTLAPDDDPAFLHNATQFEEQAARIRRLEAELKALDDEKPKE